MRFTVSVLGTEVFSISTGDQQAEGQVEHDTVSSQTELAADVGVGFRIQANPSLIEETNRA